MGLVGTLTHASFDVVLIAVCLAGIRRSTGLTLRTNYLNNKNYRSILGFVVGLGENLFDVAVAFMSAYPSIFRRQDPRLPPMPEDNPGR
ncbi:hypothetical protein H4R99_002816 [Coemansia sp. RSA 1722]|nr:hypothetical protein IWW45_003012 [Coemansia sp. RSA 485]KAJ2601978.1 hypothetical protein H4R99_002816 [Coemansia sp. RSA 1722]KAJ2704377.1 hypothetical protein FB645_003300 [Coemansia sp. IMI 203386]